MKMVLLVRSHFIGARQVGQLRCEADFKIASTQMWQSVWPQVNMRGQRMRSSNCSIQTLHCNACSAIFKNRLQLFRTLLFCRLEHAAAASPAARCEGAAGNGREGHARVAPHIMGATYARRMLGRTS
jgi:hypothetical protein